VTQPLNLKCDILVSNFAFKFNVLYRYIKAEARRFAGEAETARATSVVASGKSGSATAELEARIRSVKAEVGGVVCRERLNLVLDCILLKL
jgi:hypothetical protein